MEHIDILTDLATADPSAFATPQHLPQWISHQADAHVLLRENGKVISHCGVWWSRVPVCPGEKIGAIGHFGTNSREATGTILARACELLANNGCTLAIGPMDGNTWRKYRLVTDFGTEPPFLMEPWNPADWASWFTASGFEPLAQYYSVLTGDLARIDERFERTLSRLGKSGVTIRGLTDYETDLARIHEISVQSFTHNYLYSELSEAEFLALYLPYKDKVHPELVLIAEHEGKPVGFVFAIPDYLQAARGVAVDTVIGKTLAVLPGRDYAGLGMVLTQLIHRRAQALGFKRLIHALQHEDNKVRNMSAFFGTVMRRYTLFSRRLRA